MVRVKVEYDKDNRAFKLVDPELGCVLEDGAQYELLVPLMFESIEEEDNDFALLSNAPLAHA